MPAIGPDLSPQTLRRVDLLFPGEKCEQVKSLLHEQCGYNLPFQEKATPTEIERFRFAALKYSDGSFAMLESAVKLAQVDWRDLLFATGFAHSGESNLHWEPKPAGERAEVDSLLLSAAIHDRMAMVLLPLGFERMGDEWRRPGAMPQILRVQTGLTSRTETRFFVQAVLEAQPVGVVLHLPRLPERLEEFREQGYVFRAGDREEALYAHVLQDVIRHAQPLFARFTSNSEVQRGFEEGAFSPHLKVEDQALIF